MIDSDYIYKDFIPIYPASLVLGGKDDGLLSFQMLLRVLPYMQ